MGVKVILIRKRWDYKKYTKSICETIQVLILLWEGRGSEMGVWGSNLDKFSQSVKSETERVLTCTEMMHNNMLVIKDFAKSFVSEVPKIAFAFALIY